MSVETAPAPEVVASDDDFHVHRYCCDPDTSLCGLSLSGEDHGYGLPDGPWDCPVCDRLQARPCGAVLCRLRSRWRDWRATP